MGRADQLAKRIFTEETPTVTGHRVQFLVPPEVPVGALQPDGVLGLTAPPTELGALGLPWNRVRREVTADVKMPGDHTDRAAFERCRLRREARWVAHLEQDPAPEDPDPQEFSAWIIAPNFPAWLRRDEARGVIEIEVLGPGVWSIGPRDYETLWIAANELPLRAELIPFLVARSGRALVEFAVWALKVKGPAWIAGVVRELPMAQQVFNEIDPSDDDPDALYKVQVAVTKKLLEMYPEAANEVRKETAEHSLVRLFERKLKRALTEPERGEIARRLETLGEERLGDVVIDLAPADLAAWLVDPNAR